MDAVTLFSPAKINLSLAITGRRTDGYHDLVSVVTKLDWGDTLHARLSPGGAASSLVCDWPGVPTDERNLVLRAARLFAEATGWSGAVAFELEKHIPVGAGLGGGSGNAVAALHALTLLSQQVLSPDCLHALAAALGSDCPLFLADDAVIMRGRGEELSPLPSEAAERIRGRRALVFKPSFGVATGPAYAALAARPELYANPIAEETRLSSWCADLAAPAEALLANTFEAVVFDKWPALPALLTLLGERHGLAGRMSGSGSACFALLPEGTDPTPAIATIRDAWGDDTLVVETRLNGGKTRLTPRTSPAPIA